MAPWICIDRSSRPPNAPPTPREVDPHLLGPEAEARCDLVAVDVQPLRGDVDVDAALAVRDREARLGAEERLVLDPDLVVALDGDVAGASGSPCRMTRCRTTFGPRIVAVAVSHRRPVRVERLLLGRALAGR